MHFLNFSFSEYTFKIYYHVYGVYACVCVVLFACMSAYGKASIFGYLKTTISSYSHAFLNE